VKIMHSIVYWFINYKFQAKLFQTTTSTMTSNLLPGSVLILEGNFIIVDEVERVRVGASL